MKLTLIVGKSGTGKDYLARAMGMDLVVSRTTRPIRLNEVDGVHHIFLTKEDYWNAHKMMGGVLAMTEFHGNFYWVGLSDLEGKSAYVIDPRGVVYFKQECESQQVPLEIRTVYIQAPAWKRIYRMITRETGTSAYRELRGREKFRTLGSIIRKSISRAISDETEFREFERIRLYDAIIYT